MKKIIRSNSQNYEDSTLLSHGSETALEPNQSSLTTMVQDMPQKQ